MLEYDPTLEKTKRRFLEILEAKKWMLKIKNG